MAILQGARITGSIIATSFIKATGFSGSLTASNLYVLGKAGIGTSSPIAPLDVQCNTGATGIILRGRADNSTALRFYANNGTTQQLYIGTDDSNIDFVSVSTRPIRFFVNDLLQYQINQLGVFSWYDGAGGTRMTLNSTGLGIGTTSPGAKLDVNGDVYISPNTAGKNTFILSTNASNDARLLMKSDTTTKVDIQANGTSYFNGGNVIIGNTTAYAGLTISDITANDTNDSLAFFYRGTAGNHESLIRFYDFRGQLNASFGNNLQDDAPGTQKADLVFKTAFNANPTERMRITNTGNVGIGTSSPSTRFHVYGTGAGFEFGVNSPNCYIETIDRESVGKDLNTGYYTRGTGSFTWNNGAYTERMRVASDGNVGIGSSSPTNKLSIGVGSPATLGSGADGLRITDGTRNVQLSRLGSTYSYAGVAGSGSILYSYDKLNIVADTNNPIIFNTGGSERVRINSGGNVGIGVTPTVIVGASGVNGKGLQGDSWTISSLQGTDESYFGNNLYSSAYNVWSNRVNAASGAYYITGGTHIFLRGAAQAAGTITPTESMRITSTGAVGIGLTNPNTKLQVSGSATIGGYNAFYSGTGVNSLNITAPLYPVLAFYYGTNLSGIITGYSDHIGLNTGAGGSKYISFEPGDSEIMRITAAGNVGIGTTSPSGILDIQSSNSGDQLVRNWNTNTSGTGKSILRIANSGNNAQGTQLQFTDLNYYVGTIAVDRTNGMAFYVGQQATPLVSERMRIDINGNVGIGTTSPIATLDIENSVANVPVLNLGGGVAVNNVSDLYVLNSYNTGGGVGFAAKVIGINISGSLTAGNIPIQRTVWSGVTSATAIVLSSDDPGGGDKDNAFQIWTSNNGVAGTELTQKFSLTAGGNVGIGTTSPVNKLHVSGSSTNLPLKLEGLTSNATGYFLTVDNTTGVVHKSTSGASGTSGTSGANGSPGTSGSSGTSGANGSPGTSGSSGSGSSGISGSSGTSGTTNIKAWVHFDGTGTPTINASLNVSSITDNNTGDYTINFTTAFANANYVVAGTATYEYENPGQSINNMFIAVPRRPTAQLAGSCRISTPGSDNALYDCKYVRVLFSN